MANIKAKALRLIDIFGAMSESDTVAVIYNHGRTTYVNTVAKASIHFKPHLGTEIIGIKCLDNIITIYF